MKVVIPIGVQGLGKSTLSKKIGQKYPTHVISQHGYKSEQHMLDDIYNYTSNINDNIKFLYIDRCNVRDKNRRDIIDSLHPDNYYDIIIVDFINTNNIDDVREIAFKGARDRPQEGQNIKYNPKNGGLALKKVINKKLLQYEEPVCQCKTSTGTLLHTLIIDVRLK
jgi:hypothetical protein